MSSVSAKMPSSNPTEISSLLQELWPDFQLTVADQLNPTSDVAIKFYEKFICDQLQIEISELQRMLIEKSSSEQAFTDILTIYSLYMCTAVIIQKLGLNELSQTFGLTDLLSPMRRKFKMSLILLSNCLIFVAGFQEFMEELKNNVLRSLNTFKNSQNKIDALKEQHNNNLLLHMKDVQKIENLRNRQDSMLQQIRSAEEELAHTTKEVNVHERELQHIQDENKILDGKLNDLLRVNKKLSSEIVNDHQNITHEKDRLIKLRNELLAESNENDAIMIQKMQSISCYKENLTCVNQFLETIPLHKLLENYEIFHKNKTEINEHHNEMKSLKDAENSDLAILKQLQETNESMQGSIQEFIIEYENKMAKFDMEIDELQIKIKAEEDKKTESSESYEKLKKEIKEMKKSSQQYKDQIEKQNIYYEETYKEILEMKAHLDNKAMALVTRTKNVLNQKEK